MLGWTVHAAPVRLIGGCAALSLIAAALLLPDARGPRMLEFTDVSAHPCARAEVAPPAPRGLLARPGPPRKLADCMAGSAGSLGTAGFAVAREDGRPLADVVLTITPDGASGATVVTTDRHGRACVPAVFDTMASVRVSRSDFFADDVTVDLDAGEHAIVVPSERSITGAVTVDGQVPAQPIRVTLSHYDGRELAALTDAEGRYEFFGLPEISWGVVRFPGFDAHVGFSFVVGGLITVPPEDRGRLTSQAVLVPPADIDVGAFLNPLTPVPCEPPDLPAAPPDATLVGSLQGSPPPVDVAGLTVVDTADTDPKRPCVVTVRAWLPPPLQDLGLIELHSVPRQTTNP